MDVLAKLTDYMPSKLNTLKANITAGVERTDEEVRHDAPLRLLAELRDQGKAIFDKVLFV